MRTPSLQEFRLRIRRHHGQHIHHGTGRPHHLRTVALVGNPNCGKTTLFNALTGLRQKVGNYPGVTVEKKEGRLLLADDSECTLLDLPGTYSLIPGSPDERIATDILRGRSTSTPTPDVIVCVVDASNLDRSLYLVSQLLDRRVPLVVALNMVDLAEDAGIHIHARRLQHALGVAVVPTIASRRTGLAELTQAILVAGASSHEGRSWELPDPVEREYNELMGLLAHHHGLHGPEASDEALTLLTTESAMLERMDRFAPELRAHVRQDHSKLDFLGIDRQSVFVEARYQWVHRVCEEAVTFTPREGATLTDRIDRIVTHRVWGVVIFLGIMAFLFQSIFTWATVPMAWINDGFDALGKGLAGALPPGELQDLIVRGALGGVAAVVTFLPQILLLFFFIGILEDSGYMARAAFVMDRVMGRVGLHGKSFIPLLSSFACAVPGIMAARTIENSRDRLATMLVAPLISCSARLPVYTLLIAAFVPAGSVLGFLSLAGLVLLSLYLLGLIAALTMAWVFKRTLLKAATPVFLMELPQYRVPSFRSVLLQVSERGISFLRRAGTVILGASILLWFLASYPRTGAATPAERLEHSFAGMAGKAIEPVLKPLGFNWKIGIGLVSSMLQREMFVSTMGTIFNIEHTDAEEGAVSLRASMRADRDPASGLPTFTLLTAVCVMVYYTLALQCFSTIAVMYRETNGWKWPAFQFGYMTVLSYVVTLGVYHAGLWLGGG